MLRVGDILLYDNHLVLYKSSLDLTFYLVAPQLEGMRKIVREKNGRGREKQPDGTYIERLPLPVELRGGGMEQVRGQTLLRVEEVKKRSLEGKVVLGSS